MRVRRGITSTTGFARFIEYTKVGESFMERAMVGAIPILVAEKRMVAGGPISN